MSLFNLGLGLLVDLTLASLHGFDLALEVLHLTHKHSSALLQSQCTGPRLRTVLIDPPIMES